MFKCLKCEQNFISFLKYSKHIRIFHLDNNEMIKCFLCESEIKTSINFWKHFNSNHKNYKNQKTSPELELTLSSSSDSEDNNLVNTELIETIETHSKNDKDYEEKFVTLLNEMKTKYNLSNNSVKDFSSKMIELFIEMKDNSNLDIILNELNTISKSDRVQNKLTEANNLLQIQEIISSEMSYYYISICDTLKAILSKDFYFNELKKQGKSNERNSSNLTND